MPIFGNSGKRLAERQEALALLTAGFPWQQYACKRGRWEREELQDFLFFVWAEWQKSLDLVQFLHPETGEPLGELAWVVDDPEQHESFPTGRVQLAGHPGFIAAVAPVGRPEEAQLAVRRDLGGQDPVDLARQLVAGTAQIEPYREEFRYGKSVWLADRPAKPTKADGFHWKRGDVDDPAKYGRIGETQRRDWDDRRAAHRADEGR